MNRHAIGFLTALSLIGGLTAQAAPATVQTTTKDQAYLGVQIRPSEKGVEIISVRPDTAASRAGLKEGDQILSMGETPIDSTDALGELVSSRSAGERIVIRVLRDGKEFNAVVNLGTRPDATVATPTAPTRKSAKTETAEKPTRELAPKRVETPTEGSAGAPRGGGFLGVMIEVDDADGARIAEVQPGSPAAKGRLQKGDVIVAIDGDKVASPDALKQALSRHAPGEEIQVTVQRDGGQEQRIVKLAAFDNLNWGAASVARGATVTPTPEPKKAPAAPQATREGGRGWIGIYFAEAENGVLVDNTVPDGPAAKAGLKSGDVIISIAEKKIAGSEDLMSALERAGAGRTVAVTLLRDGKPLEYDVRLTTRPEEIAVAEVVPEAAAPSGSRVKRPLSKGRPAAPRAELRRKATDRAAEAREKAAVARKKAAAERRKAKEMAVAKEKKAVARKKAENKKKAAARKKATARKKADGKKKASRNDAVASKMVLDPKHDIVLVPDEGGGYRLRTKGSKGLSIPAHGKQILILDSSGDDGVELYVVGEEGNIDREVVTRGKKGGDIAFFGDARGAHDEDHNVEIVDLLAGGGGNVWFSRESDDDDGKVIVIERSGSGGGSGCCCCCCCKNNGHSRSSGSERQVIRVLRNKEKGAD